MLLLTCQDLNGQWFGYVCYDLNSSEMRISVSLSLSMSSVFAASVSVCCVVSISWISSLSSLNCLHSSRKHHSRHPIQTALGCRSGSVFWLLSGVLLALSVYLITALSQSGQTPMTCVSPCTVRPSWDSGSLNSFVAFGTILGIDLVEMIVSCVGESWVTSVISSDFGQLSIGRFVSVFETVRHAFVESVVDWSDICRVFPFEAFSLISVTSYSSFVALLSVIVWPFWSACVASQISEIESSGSFFRSIVCL